MKYAVAVCVLSQGLNEVKIVEANSEIEAIVLAVGDNADLAEDFETIQDAIHYYWDGEIAVSHPIAL